jgi:gamma-polyglutamate biosynthesis protein CapC
VALGFLASPKTYIILLTGAYLATRNSLAWGWDSHGIVVLALVALAWLSPLKVLTTVVEVLVLVVAVRAVLALPGVRTANLEGYRRIVVVFGIGFALKFAACHVMAATYPGLRATDYFGFGYLLPSLLALKILQRGSATVILLPTLQTSLVALGLGTVIGLGLALLDPNPGEAAPASDLRAVHEEVRSGVVGEVQRASGRLLCGLQPALRHGDDATAQLATWQALVGDLARAETVGDLETRARALGLQMSQMVDPHDHQRYWVLREPPGALRQLRGWGVVVVRPDAATELVVEVPHPVHDTASLISGAVLFQALGARMLLVSGVDPGLDMSPTARMSSGGGLPLTSARRALGDRPVLEVRTALVLDRSVLWERPGTLSEGELQRVAEILGGVDPQQVPLDGTDAYGTRSAVSRARVALSGAAVRQCQILAHPRDTGHLLEREEAWGLSALAGRDWFVEQTTALGYREPRETERVFLDREVLTPLLRDAEAVAADSGLLGYLDRTASLVGYALQRVTLGDGEPVVLLYEAEPATRGWGAVLVRPRSATARFVAVPKPATERYSLDLALHLLRELDGHSLLVAGAEPTATLDESSNVVGEGNLETVFTHAHRVAFRQPPTAPGGEPPLGLQVRGYRSWRPLRSPVILSTGLLAEDLTRQPQGLAAVGETLRSLGVPVRGYDGTRELVALRGYGIPQVHVARNLDGQAYAVVWASRDLRRRVATREGDALTRTAVRAGLEPREVWLDDHWADRVLADALVTPSSLETPPPRLDRAWRATLSRCASLVRTGDVRYLGDAVEEARAGGIEAVWLVDRESGLPVLWLSRDSTTAAVNLLTVDVTLVEAIDDPPAALRTGLVSLILAEEG